jgi:hypothetical protein
MHTLHEYMMLTKSQEYLIAVGCMIIFILFWRFAAQRR